MKNLLTFLYDSILVICFLFIVSFAFLATYALSPIPYGKSHLVNNQSNVLGKEDRAIIFEDAYRQGQDFDVSSLIDSQEYKAIVDYGPLDAGSSKEALVKLRNPSGYSKVITFQLKSAYKQSKGLDIFLEVDGNTIVSSNDQSEYALKAKDEVEVNLVVDSPSNVNFPIEIEVLIDAGN